MRKKILLVISFMALCSLSSFAEFQSFEPGTKFEVAFSPNGECQNNIIQVINAARKTILVQGYSFTSAPIAKALLHAKKRGVVVKIILDKSQVTAKYSSSNFFKNQKFPLWIDYRPAIAHNKVMILDNSTVITGSFNFTKSAQVRNAENVIIIKSKKLATIYTKDWNNRFKKSETIKAYSEYKKKHKERKRDRWYKKG